MAKRTRPAITDDALSVGSPPLTATRQRGVTESAEFVPLQFKFPKEFVRDFKNEANNRYMKLNDFLVLIFEEFMKNAQ